MKPKIIRLTQTNVPEKMRCTLNSYLGLLSHYKSYHLRQTLFRNLSFVYHYGYYHTGVLEDSSTRKNICDVLRALGLTCCFLEALSRYSVFL